MDQQTRIVKTPKKFARALFIKKGLKDRALFFVRAGKKSKIAAKEILYGLPGVFAMSLSAEGKEIRLIKEADEFRIMENSESSDILLKIRFHDLTVLRDIASQETTLQKAFAERRISFSGQTKYFTAIARVSAEGDKYDCSETEYFDLYGKGKE